MELQRFIIAGGGKLRYQDFTSSGTFTPSAELLAKGGQCFVILIAGGGAGGSNNASSSGQPGDAGEVRREVVTVSGAITVTIGAGGAGTFAVAGNPGSNSAFGSLLTAAGGAGGGGLGEFSFSIRGGKGALGFGSFHPDEAFSGTSLDARGGIGWSGRAGGGGGWGQTLVHSAANSGGGSAINTSQTRAPDGAANTGGGGAGTCVAQQTTGGNGGSGWCRVIWFE